jgi:rubrerythrin
MDARTEEIVQGIIRRDELSLLQYVADSYPWTPAKEDQVWASLQAMIADEREGTGQLVRFVRDHKGALPYVGTYPSNYTTINFISLDNLLPRLASYQEQAVSALTTDLAQLNDPEAIDLVQKILDMKQRHLQTLQELTAANPQPVAQ